jgi:hypothetical protein
LLNFEVETDLDATHHAVEVERGDDLGARIADSSFGL